MQEEQTLNCKRVVLSTKLIDFLSTYHEDVLPYFFNKYEHEAHQFGIDLYGALEEEDVTLLSAYMDQYFRYFEMPLDGYEL